MIEVLTCLNCFESWVFINKVKALKVPASCTKPIVRMNLGLFYWIQKIVISTGRGGIDRHEKGWRRAATLNQPLTDKPLSEVVCHFDHTRQHLCSYEQGWYVKVFVASDLIHLFYKECKDEKSNWQTRSKHWQWWWYLSRAWATRRSKTKLCDGSRQ